MLLYEVSFKDKSRIKIASHPPYLSINNKTLIVFHGDNYTRAFNIEIISDIKEILK